MLWGRLLEISSAVGGDLGGLLQRWLKTMFLSFLIQRLVTVNRPV